MCEKDGAVILFSEFKNNQCLLIVTLHQKFPNFFFTTTSIASCPHGTRITFGTLSRCEVVQKIFKLNRLCVDFNKMNRELNAKLTELKLKKAVVTMNTIINKTTPYHPIRFKSLTN